jgi:streptogramin lyase
VKSIYKNFVRTGGVIASLVGVLAITAPVQALSIFASGFTNPTGIAFDSSGSLFVANNSNSISKISGSTRSTFATGLNNPSDLAFNASGNLYVADTFNNRVKGFDPSGSLIFNTNTSLNQPRGLAFGSNGNLFVTNPGNGNIAIYGSDGSGNLSLPGVTGNFNGISNSFGIAIEQRVTGDRTSQSNIIGVPRRINRELASETNLPDNSQALDLVIDQVSGNLYASDFSNNVVYQIDSVGTLTILISGLNQPSYLAINGDNLYISDNGSGNILEFQLRTTPIPFEFNPALGIGVLGGLFVANKLRKKLKK